MELKHFSRRRFGTVSDVLIVPYGIETYVTQEIQALDNVLIVPYGIETCRRFGVRNRESCVNCTLWN